MQYCKVLFLCLSQCIAGGGILCSGCSSLHLSTCPKLNILNTILKSVGHTFARLWALVHFGARMNAQVLGLKDQRVKRAGKCTLLMQYLENYRIEFHQTFSTDPSWDKGANFGGQNVKG